MTDVFSGETKPTIPDNALETLVGEDKRYKDVESLAKAALEKDAFIEKLKGENEEAGNQIAKDQEAIKKLETVQEIYDKLKSPNPDASQQATQTNEGTQAEISAVDIEKMVQDQFAKTASQAEGQRNVDAANKALVDKFGDNAATIVQKRSQELGMSLEELQSLASRTPDAFLTLVGASRESTQSQTITTPTSTVRIDNSGGNVRNEKYYQELKLKDPTAYFSKETRAQKLKDAIALGDNFYN